MFRKVLFPTDFSQGAYKAIRIFEKKNHVEIQELILMSVVEESLIEEMMDGYSLLYNSEMNELKDIEKKLTDERMKKLEEKGRIVQEILKPKKLKLKVEVGLSYKKILETADEEDVSLILLPSHGKLDFTDVFLGSTTGRVLKTTKKPVLLIKTYEAV